jgi:addiction module RelE/StbE family toxin
VSGTNSSGSNPPVRVSYTLITAAPFLRQAKKFLRKHPELKDRYTAVLRTLQQDPFAQSLRTHQLHGELEGYWGVSITRAYRLVITIRITAHEVELLDIGTHDEVY